MNKKTAKKMLEAEKACNEKITSANSCNHDCYDCKLCYEQGNMEEHIKALEIAIEALDLLITMEGIKVLVAE